ncbi:hypothetical protein FNF31_00986 [Cafeteria roenbergensis]|uniref:Uncharacterized protein n=1 Tax=Cafeteria roenbergensis TaxID=33653 RepID=A0A5A8DTC6_CAFRO|nr:hypothetical protein FNF31_00986 [Cafeteria roenbergensis]
MAAAAGSSLSEKYARMAALADAEAAAEEADSLAASKGRAPIKLEPSGAAERYTPGTGPPLLSDDVIAAVRATPQSLGSGVASAASREQRA